MKGPAEHSGRVLDTGESCRHQVRHESGWGLGGEVGSGRIERIG